MTFQESISTCFKKYVDFNGRATKSEFWWFYLLQVCLNITFQILSVVATAAESSALVALIGILSTICSLALFLPMLAVSARRLHDSNHSGWWYLIALTCIGIFYLLYLWAADGDKGANQYGPNPEGNDDDSNIDLPAEKTSDELGGDTVI